MTTVIESSNGWAVVRERDRHVLGAASSTAVVPGFTAGRRGA